MQKDYPLTFKLAVVKEYETRDVSLESLKKKYGIQGSHTIKDWINKYGTFDKLNQTSRPMGQTKDHKMMELVQKVRLLERQNARLEKELERKNLKADFFDMMIEIAEKEYKIDIRKNYLPEQSTNSKK